MGGIRNTGVVVDCDRCKKAVVVDDEKEAQFYRDHAARGDDKRDVRMFVAILNLPDGETVGIDMEYVCPACCRKAILTYLTKIDKALSPKKENGSKVESESEDKKPEAKEKSKTEAKEKSKTEDKKSVEPPAQETEPAPPPSEPGADFVDEDLFA